MAFTMKKRNGGNACTSKFDDFYHFIFQAASKVFLVLFMSQL